MRLSLLLASSLPALSFANPLQSPFIPFVDPPRTLSTTIVDILSNHSEYSSLLRLVQRAKLIPTLNRLNGSTFFAPTNDAIHRHSLSNPLWLSALSADSDSAPLLDNVKQHLREQLLYHLLNYTIALPKDQDILVTRTLHFPYVSTNPPTNEPPPRPPWMPVPGGALGGEPQRLRVAARGEDVRVGVDAFGNGGAKVVKGDPAAADNGIVIGIDAVLDVPSHLVDVVASQPSLSYFRRILTPEVKDRLANTSELTVFIPVDAAFDELPEYERLFLQSELAAEDLQRIFEMHAVVQDTVTYSESFHPGVNLTTLHGQTLEVVSALDNRVLVSDAELVQPDIYASNGVLHTISSLLIPSGALQLTPEKLLLTYNCSKFISLLHSVNLTGLVNNTDEKYTVLAPPDDVISVFGDDGNLPERGSEELRRALEYHFLPGKWTPKKLQGLDLVETALTEDGLDGGRQVIQVNAKGEADSQSAPAIRFGGASVVGDPLEVNNTLIYFLSRPLTPPTDTLATALPSLDLSNFLAAVFSAEVADVLKKTPRTTLLVPVNAAFTRLGSLVAAHLLSAPAKADLRNVVLHHALNDVFYATDLRNGSARTYSTLEGSAVTLARASNGSIALAGSGGWPAITSALDLKNTPTRTGALHELSDVLLPLSVNLTLGKLARAAGGTTMVSLVARAGMDWILNGTAPPADSEWADDGVEGTGWTLLCPEDGAFQGVNLTALYADDRSLRALVSQHLVRAKHDPAADGDRPLALADRATYKTLLSPWTDYGDVIFRTNDTGGILVGIKGARGTAGRADWANVRAWGRATTGGGSGGVLQLDRLLMPYTPPWWFAFGAPVAVSVVGVLLIVSFFAFVRAVWKRDAREATYEPIGGFVNDDDDS